MAHEIVYVSSLEDSDMGAYQDKCYEKVMNSPNEWESMLGSLANIKKWWIAYLFLSWFSSLISSILFWFGHDLVAILTVIVLAVSVVSSLENRKQMTSGK